MSNFDDIRNFTDNISPHPGEFKDLYGYFCHKEDKLTLNTQHTIEFNNAVEFRHNFKTRCCKQVLIHCLKSYNTDTQWFFPDTPKHIYCFVFHNRYWRSWEDMGIIFAKTGENVSGNIQEDKDFNGFKY